jgi:glycosyltransferase 2 family protein
VTTESSTAPRGATRRRLALVIRILAIIAVAVALWWFVRNIEVGKLGKALTTAEPWPLVLAAIVNFVCLLGKAVSWRIMLASRHQVSVPRLYRYTIAAFAASAIAPARAGELLRLWTLKRRDGVPIAETAAVAVAEKLMDGISMLILVAPVPLFLPGLPGWVTGSIAGCAAIAIAMFIVLFIAVGRVDPSSVGRFRRFLAGMHVLRSPKRLLGSLVVLIVVWLADLGQVMAVLYAVDIDLTAPAGLLILFSLNLLIVFPSTPAQVGALEVGALAALQLLHVDEARALAFALLYHMLQVIPLIAAGLILEWRLILDRNAPLGAEAPAEALRASDPAPRSQPQPPPASATPT